MFKKNISKSIILKVVLTITLIILATYANFVTIRRMAVYAIEVDFYNKLSVAYDLGGVEGINSELFKIESRTKLRHELKIAAEFKNKLGSLREPKDFIESSISEANKKIKLLSNLRRIALALILVILVLKFFYQKNRRTKED